MGLILDTVITLMNDLGWKFQQSNEESLTLAFQGKNGSWSFYLRAYEEKKWFTAYAVGAQNIPHEKLTEIALFFTEANYGVTLGNFELDLKTGEYHFKTSIDFRVYEPTPRAIKFAIYNSIIFMDDYLIGIKAILEENKSYQEAIKLIEG